jgi:hypothetical protein
VKSPILEGVGMLSHPVSQSLEEPTIYRPTTIAPFFTVVMIVFIALPVIVIFGGLMIRSGRIYPAIFCFALPFLLVLCYCFYAYRAFGQTYLAVSLSGLEYHTAGLTIQTPWHNIECLLDEHLLPRLLLRQPSAVEMRIWATMLAPGRARYDPPVDLLIPLFFFQFSRRSALGQQLQLYAPRLFERAVL